MRKQLIKLKPSRVLTPAVYSLQRIKTLYVVYRQITVHRAIIHSQHDDVINQGESERFDDEGERKVRHGLLTNQFSNDRE